MKKFFFTFLVGGMFFSNVFVANANFSDVDESDTYNVAIEILQELGVINGYPDGSYRPDQNINRAELLKILIEASGVTDEVLAQYGDDSCFNDVSPNQWYTKYVCYAKFSGYVQGYENGKFFRPEQPVTFVEALKMTMAVFGLAYDTSQDPWYFGVVNSASEDNLIPQDVNGFNEPFNRGQMADLVTRVIKNKEGKRDEYLDEYKDGRVNVVLDYDNIVIEEEKERLNDLTEGNVKSNFVSSYTFTSRLDLDRVFTLLQSKAEDLNADYVKELNYPVLHADEYSVFYYIDQPTLFPYELEKIAASFSFDGSGENLTQSDADCFYTDMHDFSLLFPASWGLVDKTMFLDEDFWKFAHLDVYEAFQRNICEFGPSYDGSQEEDPNGGRVIQLEP